MRHTPTVTVLLAATLALAACGGGSKSTPKPASAASVTIASFKYAPATITVKAGSTLRFTNRDRAEHTATSAAGGFDSGTLRTGQSKALVVAKPGTYVYTCAFHPFMRGEVVVAK